MTDQVKILRQLIAKKGLVQVSAMLGHSSSSRLNRWVKSGKIPKAEQGVVKILLEQNGGAQ